MVYNSKTYQADIKKIGDMPIPFAKLQNKSVMITGAAGLIGSFLVDVLMYRNREYNDNIKVIAWGYTKEDITSRFPNYVTDSNFDIIGQDVNLPLTYNKKVDYIMHLASNAHPRLFATDPVGTIKANVIGLNNLLEYAQNNHVERLLYVSTGEVYGQATSDIKEFTEEYSGYVDPTKARSCYPASKRVAETLCVSYTEQYNISTVIARPCHIYGPTKTSSDTRAYAEFINNVLNNEDIVMKSKGEQVRSYCYVADCVSALLFILLNGEDKNAYNIAYSNSITSIFDMAQTIARIGHKKVILDIPSDQEKKGYNPVTFSVLSSSKLEKLGWYGQYDLFTGYQHTIDILKEVSH